MIRKALPLLAAVLLASSLSSAFAQDPTDVPETKFQKTLHRFDLGLFGVGEYNSTVSGPVLSKAAPNYCYVSSGVSTNCGNNPITQFGSNTFGGLFTLRYISKPYVGLELNYGYARYTENYEGQGVAGFTTSTTANIFQVQSKVSEYSFGYVATPEHTFFGLFPFVSGGIGTLAFKPTARGGEEEPEKARMLYYYSVGVQQSYANGHFGLRAGFRELFFLDPDFGQNYLTILKHATTYEPMAGFYFRY